MERSVVIFIRDVTVERNKVRVEEERVTLFD